VNTPPQRPAIVIDASVATKWLLRDEDQLEAADRLLGERDEGRLRLTAPEQIEVEVANSIRKAVLNGRLSLTDGEAALDRWLRLARGKLELASNTALLPEALMRSVALGTTLFDALYLVVAEAFGLDLVTADERFLRSPAGALPFVFALSRYSTGRETEAQT
jgi:predicted nucleic acid-binding protein